MSLPDKTDLAQATIHQQSVHVAQGDKPAEFADRRNQVGQAFDENVNEFTQGSTLNAIPQSAEINDLNRYANVDNAQKRTLNPDGSVPHTGSE